MRNHTFAVLLVAADVSSELGCTPKVFVAGSGKVATS